MDLRLANGQPLLWETKCLARHQPLTIRGARLSASSAFGCGKSTLLGCLGGAGSSRRRRGAQTGTPPAGCLNRLTMCSRISLLLPWAACAQLALVLEGSRAGRRGGRGSSTKCAGAHQADEFADARAQTCFLAG